MWCDMEVKDSVFETCPLLLMLLLLPYPSSTETESCESLDLGKSPAGFLCPPSGL